MNEDEIKRLSQIYTMSDQLFESTKNELIFRLSANKYSSDSPTLIIVGGQSGAGKSRLSPLAKNNMDNNVIHIDIDEVRASHPYFSAVNKSYPEFIHRILVEDSIKLENAIVDYFLENKFNILYEGTLRNTDGYVKLASRFKEMDYNVLLYLMAVPELESLGSIYSRYAMDVVCNGKPRWVEKFAHDESYTGLIKTLQIFQDKNLFDSAKVFVRGEDSPKEIYSTENRQFNSPIQAIEYGRETGRKQAIQDYYVKHDMVVSVLKAYPDLLSKLREWEDFHKSEYSKLFPTTNYERSNNND